jgi:hypothetical protein
VPLTGKVAIHSREAGFGRPYRKLLTFGSLSSARFGPFVHAIETMNLPRRFRGIADRESDT